MLFLTNSMRCSKSTLLWGMMKYSFDSFDNVANIIISTTISQQAKSALPWQAFAAQKASRPCVVSHWKVSFGGPGELREVLQQCTKRTADGELREVLPQCTKRTADGELREVLPQCIKRTADGELREVLPQCTKRTADGELREVLPQCTKRTADGERNISLCNEVGQMVSAPKS